MSSGMDKSIQRQRICDKCKSFVTYGRDEQGRERCPLCTTLRQVSPNRGVPISQEELTVLILSYQASSSAEKDTVLGFEMALDEFIRGKLPALRERQKNLAAEAKRFSDLDESDQAESSEPLDSEGADEI